MKRRAAFTLIELIAVALIFGLLAGLALPNFGFRAGRVLEEQAQRMAADIEFARQRSVMTGAPHRLVMDLEAMEWWLEWWVLEARAFGSTDEPESVPRAEAEALALSGQGPLDLSPPQDAEPDWHRVTGPMGNVRRLDPLVFFDHVETPEGAFERGEIQLVFEGDGTTDATWIVLARDDGSASTLEIEPLADSVRFERGTL